MIADEDKDFMPPLDNLTAALAPVKRLDLGVGFTPSAQFVNYQRDSDSAYPRVVQPAAVRDAPILSANCHDAATRDRNDKRETRRNNTKRNAHVALEGTLACSRNPTPAQPRKKKAG